MTELCKCGEPADGLGPNTCQMCWEQHCADTYWDQHNAMVQADIALFEVHARERGLNLSRVPSCNDYFDDSTQEACIAWLAAKEQAAQQREGFVLVPVEPNIHMIGAGMGGFVFPLDGGSFSKGEMVQAYKAMIAAAQEPT